MVVAVCFVLLVASALHVSSGHAEVHPLASLRHDRARIHLNDTIRLDVYPTLLNSSGEWVQCFWRNVGKPAAGDWVGVFLLHNTTESVDPKNNAPTKFQYANVSRTYLSYGFGSFNFRLVNMRGIFKMAFFRGGFQNPVMVAVSDSVLFKNPNEPTQPHLSATHNHSEYLLQWVTRDTDQAKVKWGLISKQYTSENKAVSTTYRPQDMCDSPAKDYGWIDPGQIHTALIDNLQPGKTYFYVFGDSYGWSKEYTFRAPHTTSQDVTTRVIAFGDIGHGEYDDSRQVRPYEQPALNTTNSILQELNTTDIMITVGDLSYADGYAAEWDEFSDQMKNITPYIPYMVCPGNHESDSKNSDAFYQGHDSGGECNVPYINRYAMPRPGPDQPWYGFEFGSIHFVMMSTEHNFTKGSKQYNFLSSYLNTINRTRTPWFIFSGHRPMYIDSTNITEPSGELPVAHLLQTHIEPLIIKHKADLAFWGHHHSYQRTCPVAKQKCTAGATVHVVMGMAGRHLMTNVKPVKPSWLMTLDDQHWGYTKFVANATTLDFKYIRNDDREVHDHFILQKG